MMGVLSNAISQARQLQLTAGEHILSGAPAASATKAFLRLGSTAIANGDADGTYIGINAPSAYAGHAFRFEVNGALKTVITQDGFLGIGGGTPNSGRPIYALVSGNALFPARFENSFDGVQSQIAFSPVSGTSQVASGNFTAWHPTHNSASGAYAGRIGIQCSSVDATTGIMFAAEGATQDVRWRVGSGGEAMGLSPNGELQLSRTPQASGTQSLFALGSAITGGSANGSYMGLRMPTGYAGDALRFEHADDSTGPAFCLRVHSGITKVGIGKSPTAGDRRLVIQSGSNNEVDASMGLLNTSDGTAAGVVWSLSSGTSAACSGFLAAYNGNYTGLAAYADRMILGCNSTASGLILEANTGAAQDIRFRVATLNEQMRLSSAGELLLGTTSSLGRFAVVGRADQSQFHLRANGTQTTNILEVTDSAGTGTYLQLDSSARFIVGAQTSPTHRVEVFGSANDTVAGSVRTRNATSGTNALCWFQAQSGTAGAAVGTFGAASTSYNASGQLTGRVFVHTGGSSETGITLSAAQAGQDLRINTGGAAERVRITAAGEVLIGTTSTLGKLAVLGGSDQSQLLIRAFSTQTSALVDFQQNGGTSIWQIANNGNVTHQGTQQSLALVINSNTAGANRFGTAGAVSGAMLTLSTGGTGNVGLAIKGVASQTASLITLNQISSTSTTREVASVNGGFVVATDVSRTGFLQLSATDFNATRNFLRGEADGTNPLIGVLGATPVARQTVTGSRGGNAALASLLTAMATFGWITDSTSA